MGESLSKGRDIEGLYTGRKRETVFNFGLECWEYIVILRKIRSTL